ncbi:diguanylate cyclase domain-containing protein [Psychromonas sp. PT13]|uniref:diguanylate cyclase domain-containing protein n=1 Tax=Psychromonas sp. PT13 TaxID=3439547 RepID=UPI003EBEDA15
MPISQLAEHPQRGEQNHANMTAANNATENSSFDRVMLQMNIADQHVFKSELAQQWQKAAFEHELISVLSCEIDFYDEYVKNYGVQGASFMLISVALTLKNICDLYGCLLTRNAHQGFNILVKGGTETSVKGIADGLCDAVKQSKTEHKYSKIGNIVTLSMGVSALYPQTMELFKEKAKVALHHAQDFGGNQCCNDPKKDVVPTIEDAKTEQPEMKQEQPVIEAEISEVLAEEPIEIEPEAVERKSVLTRMYRGRKIEVETKLSEKNAPISTSSAPNKDSVDFFAEPEKPKQKEKPVRMYRGQIIRD